MVRKLLRNTVPIATGIILTAALLFGAGQWRRSEDTKWCRDAAMGGVVAGGGRVAQALVDEMRAACTVQRQRQRVMLGAVWRTGGEEMARCGCEFARMQLISYRDADGHTPILSRYGINDPDFDVSNREHQDLFIRACLADRGAQAR